MVPDGRPFESRLAAVLLDLQAMELTQSVLAQTLGSSRSRVNRQLRDWSKVSTIKLSEGRVAIENREALAAIAQRDETSR